MRWLVLPNEFLDARRNLPLGVGCSVCNRVDASLRNSRFTEQCAVALVNFLGFGMRLNPFGVVWESRRGNGERYAGIVPYPPGKLTSLG